MESRSADFKNFCGLADIIPCKCHGMADGFYFGRFPGLLKGRDFLFFRFNFCFFQIHVSRADDAGQAVVEIIDNGPGIAEDLLPNVLFEPFKTSKDGGSGIRPLAG